MTGRERYVVDRWYDAPMRKGRNNNRVGGSKSGDPVVTKYFVSNLPGGCSSKDMHDVLKTFGSIQGTYIARKFDKLGKRFGFVSFANVRDPISLEKDLKDVWMGSYKLYIVLARFVDGERVSGKEDKQWVPVNKENNDKVAEETVNVVINNPKSSSSSGGRSFRDTLLGKDGAEPTEEVRLEDDFIGVARWNGLGLLGDLKDLQSLTSLKEWLGSVRLDKVGIRYVGGLSVILVFEDKVSMMDFLSTKEVWESIFVTLVLWGGQKLRCERIAWLRILGIPLLLFENMVAERIASKIGRVVQTAQIDDKTEDFSYAMVAVICNSVKRITKGCKLKWRSEEFDIAIEEEIEEWIPDCIGLEVEEQEVVSKNVKRPVDGVDQAGWVNTDVEVNNVVVEDAQEVEEIGVSTLHANMVDVEVAMQQVETSTSGGTLPEVDGLSFSLQDPLVCSNSKEKKRGCLRKKSRGDKSQSPTGAERPKKRARDDDDPYDIDRFIFNVQGGHEAPMGVMRLEMW
ncbi:putative RNA recognition motif domain, nucleotide-binding alpha-beta plait domain superfamily [Helianthus debilis subsp. tardiflorus]